MYVQSSETAEGYETSLSAHEYFLESSMVGRRESYCQSPHNPNIRFRASTIQDYYSRYGLKLLQNVIQFVRIIAIFDVQQRQRRINISSKRSENFNDSIDDKIASAVNVQTGLLLQ